MKFIINPHIPIQDIHSSMQLESGQEIAQLIVGDWKLYLEVHGDVRVKWNPDPDGDADDGQIYKSPSQFPDELMDIFANGIDTNGMKNLEIIDNNWFELFVDYKGRNIHYDVVDDETWEPVELFSFMYETYIGFKKQEEGPKGTPGAVISGTLRNRDLIPTFRRVLYSLDRERCREFVQSRPHLEKSLCDIECGIETGWWESEQATFVFHDLIFQLTQYSPDGYYFGAEKDHDSVFGFFPIEDLPNNS